MHPLEENKPESQAEAAVATHEAVMSSASHVDSQSVETAPDALTIAQQNITQLETQLKEAQEQFLRAKAETENMRRRAQEDIAKAHKFGTENFAESLLPVKDSLERALTIENATLESYKEGMEITLRQLVSAFERNRLLEVAPQMGEKFDPMKHQAVSMVPAEQAANTVVACMQKGYLIAERVLRPALVTVAQG